MILLVIMCWIATISLFAWHRRPRPDNLTATLAVEAVASPRSSSSIEHHLEAIEQLGSVLQRRVPALVALPSRSLGAAVVVLLPLMLVSPTWAFIGSIVTAAAMWWQQHRAVLRRHRRVEQVLPAFIEMLRMSIDAGLSTRLAFVTVAPLVADELRPTLQRALVELDRGESLADVLRRLGGRLGGSAEELMGVLAGAERSGAPLGPLLVRVADDLRRAQRVAGEARARRLPVLLLVPLVFCVLPAFAIVAVVPMLVTGTSSFSFPSP